MADAVKTYRAKVGLNYPDPKNPGKEKRVEPGAVADDIPAHALPWLIEQGAIELVEKPAAAPVAIPVPVAAALSAGEKE